MSQSTEYIVRLEERMVGYGLQTEQQSEFATVMGGIGGVIAHAVARHSDGGELCDEAVCIIANIVNSFVGSRDDSLARLNIKGNPYINRCLDLMDTQARKLAAFSKATCDERNAIMAAAPEEYRK